MRKLSNKELKSVAGGKKSWWWCFMQNFACTQNGDGLVCKGYYDNCT